LEDPVLQALFECLRLVVGSDSTIRGVFETRMSRHLGIFLPDARARFVSNIFLSSEEAVVTPDGVIPEAHQCFLTISLLDAIAELPLAVAESAHDRLSCLGWTQGWVDRAQSFRARTSHHPDCLDLSCEETGDGVVRLRGNDPGVLRVLFHDGFCFVRHDSSDRKSFRFCGLEWPANHTLWLKAEDWVQVGNQRLTRKGLEFIHARRAEAETLTPLRFSNGGVSLGGEGSGAIGFIHHQAGWMVSAKGGSGVEIRLDGVPIDVATPLLPDDTLTVNGRPLPAKQLLTLASGNQPSPSWKVSLDDVDVVFPDGQKGLDGVSVTLEAGDLVAVMGPSGCGKSTFISLLSGELQACRGMVIADKVCGRKPVFAVVPQDDVLFQELTVRENLNFALSLRRTSAEASEVDHLRVDHSLQAVRLWEKSDLRVGSVTAKVLSGGERKRLNVGLELVGSPDALLLDEPTSGLSSADADQMMSLLRSRADQGMLVLAVIHQPSQEIFESFDKVIVLDVGGKLAFFGSPDAAKGFFQIHVPGAAMKTWSPDRILDALIGRWSTLDETSDRRVFDPQFWKMRYGAARSGLEPLTVVREDTQVQSQGGDEMERDHHATLLSKIKTLLKREALRKRREWKTLLASCLVAGALAILIGWVCRSTPAGESYSFSENTNLPAFYFLSSVLVGFLALSVSTQEMVSDRPHRLRERLIRIPAPAWLVAKLPALILLLIIQAAIVTLCGSILLQIPYGHFETWLSLTLMGLCCGILGLLVSSLPGISERLALSLVPLLLVPQMMLSGAQPFSFSEISHLRFAKESRSTPEDESGQGSTAPWIANLMPGKWAYQSMVCAMRDSPRIAVDTEQNLMLTTYNQARGLAELWRDDRSAFLTQMEGKTGRALTEQQIRHEISEIHRLGLRTTEDVKGSFGDLVLAPPDEFRELAKLKNRRLIIHAEQDMPRRSSLLGWEMSPVSEGWLILGLGSGLLFLLASGASLVSPRQVLDLRSVLRARRLRMKNGNPTTVE
jgi:ABC-type multidrug transport system ATPase subunit